jgi:hypothetical protein
MSHDAPFVFLGDSFADWANSLTEFEQTVTPGDGFAFSVGSIRLGGEFLRRLRCLNLADFEAAERPSELFRSKVVLPLLTPEEQASISPRESLLPFFRRSWNLSETEVEAASEIFVLLRWLMRKQTGQSLNSRLHQAFDFVALFYDIYSLEASESLLQSKEPLEDQLTGLLGRYHRESNQWVRFAMGYVLVDFIGDRMHEGQIKIQVEEAFSDYAQLLARWTGRIWRR